MATARAHQGEPLDLLLHRTGIGTVALEDALELNRGLADLGPALPQGTLVTLPEPVAVSAPASATIVQLWD